MCNIVYARGLYKKSFPHFDDLALVYVKDKGTRWILKSLLNVDTTKNDNGYSEARFHSNVARFHMSATNWRIHSLTYPL